MNYKGTSVKKPRNSKSKPVAADADLTTEQQEILLISAEECAEITQIISKIFRFGLDSRWPASSADDNQAKLESEIGDLTAMIFLMNEKGLIRSHNVEQAARAKIQKLKKWSSIDLEGIDEKL